MPLFSPWAVTAPRWSSVVSGTEMDAPLIRPVNWTVKGGALLLVGLAKRITLNGGRTVIVTAAVPVRPSLSVTVSRRRFVPIGRLTMGRTPVANEILFCDHTYETMLPSGSAEALPSSVTATGLLVAGALTF